MTAGDIKLRPLLDIIVEQVGADLPDGCDAWGIRAVHPDLRSSHGFRWPYPGGVAVAVGPILDHRDSCPQVDGDGICTATTAEGMASGGIPAITVLLTAHAAVDVVGDSDAGKLRLSRAHVVEVVDLPGLGRAGQLYGANLYGANLRGADLGGADLGGANLYGANLYGADLYGADLGGADLGGAYLYGADLGGAYLGGANLYGADLRGADFYGAVLGGANLYGADLRGANLAGADLGDWERGGDGIAQRRPPSPGVNESAGEPVETGRS